MEIVIISSYIDYDSERVANTHHLPLLAKCTLSALPFCLPVSMHLLVSRVRMGGRRGKEGGWQECDWTVR